MADIKQTVIKIVADMVKRNPEEISGETLLAQDLGIKSANRIGLSALLEDQYNIEISIFDIMKAKTIDDICAMIKSKQPQS